MKKILLISNMYPSKEYPHYGIFVKNSAEILRKEGYFVDVIALKKRNSHIRKVFGYFIFYLKIIFKGLFNDYYAIYSHYASHTATPLLILNFFKKNNIVMNVHGNDIVPETKKDNKYNKIVRKVLNISDVIISPSDYFKNVLINEYNIVPSKIVVYPSGGIDINKFYSIPRDAALDYLKLDKNNIYIGYVGRIEENKGWDIFLKACKNILMVNKKIMIIVAGSGSQDKYFNDLLKQLKIENRVIKYNLLSQEELLYIYNSLEVFVFPTYRKSESLGLVGLEAMACGIKTVLPNKYGPSSYAINENNSFVFESQNVSSLNYTILKALECKNNSIKQNAKNTASKFSEDKTKSILINVFKKFE